MEDSKIIELFFARSEMAIKALAGKYEKLLYRIAFNILNNREDVMECLNDTYLGVWNIIPPQRPHPLSAFVCKMTRNLSLKKYRCNMAKKRCSAYDVSIEELEPFIPVPSAEEEWNAKELARAIERFLESQNEENRVLFMRRYWFSDSVKDIADLLHMRENAVSVRLNRIRVQLKKYLEKEGFSV